MANEDVILTHKYSKIAPQEVDDYFEEEDWKISVKPDIERNFESREIKKENTPEELVEEIENLIPGTDLTLCDNIKIKTENAILSEVERSTIFFKSEVVEEFKNCKETALEATQASSLSNIALSGTKRTVANFRQKTKKKKQKIDQTLTAPRVLRMRRVSSRKTQDKLENVKRRRKQEEMEKENTDEELSSSDLDTSASSKNHTSFDRILNNASLSDNVVNCAGCKQLSTQVEALISSLNILHKKVDVLQEWIINPNPSAACHAGSSEQFAYGKKIVDEKVKLDDQFFCTEVCWKTMNTCTEISDWILALLRGTFGEEKAMLFRVNPRYEDLIPFPVAFLDTAKVHFREFIRRRIKELQNSMLKRPSNELTSVQCKFYQENENSLISQLGPSLSDKADMLFRQWKKKQEQMGLELPERKKRARKTSNLSATSNLPKNRSKPLLTVPKSLIKRVIKRRKQLQDTGTASSNTATISRPNIQDVLNDQHSTITIDADNPDTFNNENSTSTVEDEEIKKEV